MLMELLHRQAYARPNHTALVYRDERVGYREMVARIERLSNGLLSLGIRSGDSVGVVLPSDPRFVVAFHAVAAIGARVVPSNPAWGKAELDHALGTNGCRAVICDERTASAWDAIDCEIDPPSEVIILAGWDGRAATHGGDLFGSDSPTRLLPRRSREPLVCQISSGSTGVPKRLNRTHGQCAAEASSYLSLGITHEDCILGAIPLFHTWGMGACLFAPAASGATLVLLHNPHPFLLQRQRALRLIEEERITVFPGVPFNFRLLAEAPDDADLSSLRLCFSAGTALPRETVHAFHERFGVYIRQLYGSSETGLIAANTNEDPSSSLESVGRPVAGIEVDVVDDAGQSVPHGEVGEVTAEGAAIASGYLGSRELARAAFRDGRYFTGDLGLLDKSGALRLVGRKKLIIEVSGFKVDPAEVEAVLDSHPAVSESVVVGVDTETAGEQQVKAVVVRADACDERDLLDYCQERLASFKVPRLIEFRNSIPRNSLGKTLRKYLIAPP